MIVHSNTFWNFFSNLIIIGLQWVQNCEYGQKKSLFNYKAWFSTDLFEHLPVVALLAHHDRLQLLWLEEVHHVHVTYLEESPLEIFKYSFHWFVEDVVDKGSHKLFPIKKRKKKKVLSDSSTTRIFS